MYLSTILFQVLSMIEEPEVTFWCDNCSSQVRIHEGGEVGMP